MFFISIADKAPRTDTMPVIKTTEYPWTEGSWRPLCYGRIAAVNGAGVLFDLTAFERDPFLGETVLDSSCVAASFDFFPEREKGALTAVIAADGRSELYLGTEQLDVDLKPAIYGGEDEQGWYWGARFCLPESVLAGVYGEGCLAPGAELLGNLYKFKRTGADAHMGAAGPMADPFIFSPVNLAPFRAVNY